MVSSCHLGPSRAKNKEGNDYHCVCLEDYEESEEDIGDCGGRDADDIEQKGRLLTRSAEERLAILAIGFRW